jgi:hypothetical protein
MKTKTYHISTMGNYAPRGCAGTDGYVIYHDSPRYRAATEEQLAKWGVSKTKAVRNAALTEICNRALQVWRSK